MSEESSLPFPYVREETRIRPQTSQITVLYQILICLQRELGREVAGNAAPGLPNSIGWHPSSRRVYASILAARWRRPTTSRLLDVRAAVDDELGAGDERGFIGREEQHSVAHRVQASAPGLDFACFGAASRTRNEDREQGRAAPP